MEQPRDGIIPDDEIFYISSIVMLSINNSDYSLATLTVNEAH